MNIVNKSGLSLRSFCERFLIAEINKLFTQLMSVMANGIYSNITSFISPKLLILLTN